MSLGKHSLNKLVVPSDAMASQSANQTPSPSVNEATTPKEEGQVEVLPQNRIYLDPSFKIQAILDKYGSPLAPQDEIDQLETKDAVQSESLLGVVYPDPNEDSAESENGDNLVEHDIPILVRDRCYALAVKSDLKIFSLYNHALRPPSRKDELPQAWNTARIDATVGANVPRRKPKLRLQQLLPLSLIMSVPVAGLRNLAGMPY
ncbi:hypothetical protein FRB90_008750 [Tulasnella sp. 427]|nr:hypothetical protein FRB90_008750 [Tulasnella sp. 427]